jgi:ArsR family metal-binding transcriptional regulator
MPNGLWIHFTALYNTKQNIFDIKQSERIIFIYQIQPFRRSGIIGITQANKAAIQHNADG